MIIRVLQHESGVVSSFLSGNFTENTLEKTENRCFYGFYKMNRSYVGRYLNGFYPFYTRLVQIITHFLQNESVSLLS